MGRLPPNLEADVDALPAAIREWVRAGLEADPSKWNVGPPRQRAPERILPARQITSVQGTIQPPKKEAAAPAGRCRYEGLQILEKWPSDCAARVERLSVRACNHPDDPGRCSREENASHKADGVRICHGRDCPLTRKE